MGEYLRLAGLYYVHYEFRDIFGRVGRRAPGNIVVCGLAFGIAPDQVLVKIALRDIRVDDAYGYVVPCQLGAGRKGKAVQSPLGGRIAA